MQRDEYYSDSAVKWHKRIAYLSCRTLQYKAALLPEATMIELLKSLGLAAVMVPVVMAVILGLIYLLGEAFNRLSDIGHRDAK